VGRPVTGADDTRLGNLGRTLYGGNLASMASGTTTRVFLARLAGLTVLDPNAEQVGRVRDVVVVLRSEAHPPRVLGLVVEVGPRRRVFVPIGQISSIDADAVIVRGRINLRRFERRAGETLVITELLDRKVALVEDSSAVTVVDVAMDQSRTRDWFVTRVAVRGGGGFRRRGQLQTLDWDQVTGFSQVEEEQGAANLLAAFDQLRAADLAHVMHELSAKRRAEVAAALDDERLADVLEELPEDDQVEILGKLEGERAADVLEAMAPDDAADLLAELPPDEQERLLALMEPDEASPVRRLLSYNENTAGGMMTTEPVILSPDATVAEALARIRDPELTPALAAQVYVCRPPTDTPTGKFLGIAHVQRLLREPPSSLVSGVADSDIDPLGPDVPLPEVTSYLATYNLVAVPIVDDADHRLGAVTVDDVLDHLLPADWRERPAGESVRGA
jgi:flagellar motility protein MotE (MotC chaperone)/sporulation protein YlmC with PRC-barrel domain